jgi:hypothetical protein
MPNDRIPQVSSRFANNYVIDRNFCYVQDGRVAAIVKFDVGKAGRHGVLLPTIYNLSSVPGPSLQRFDNLYAVNVARKVMQGIFVDLSELAESFQIMDDRIIAVSKVGDMPQFAREPYIIS